MWKEGFVLRIPFANHAPGHLIACRVSVRFVIGSFLFVGIGALFRFLIERIKRARAYAEALIAVLLEGSHAKMSMRATFEYRFI